PHPPARRPRRSGELVVGAVERVGGLVLRPRRRHPLGGDGPHGSPTVGPGNPPRGIKNRPPKCRSIPCVIAYGWVPSTRPAQAGRGSVSRRRTRPDPGRVHSAVLGR